MKKIALVLFLATGLFLAFPNQSYALFIVPSLRSWIEEKAEIDRVGVLFDQVKAEAWDFAFRRDYPLDRIFVKVYFHQTKEDQVVAYVYFRDSPTTNYVVAELAYTILYWREPTWVEKLIDRFLGRFPTKRAILYWLEQGSWIDYEMYNWQKENAFETGMRKRIGWKSVGYD